MGFIRFVLGLVAFVIAIKIAAFLVGIVLGVLGLIKIALVLGSFMLVAWLVYRLVSPRDPQQA